jgi:NADH dehydrogenase FAD-containing subunit
MKLGIATITALLLSLIAIPRPLVHSFVHSTRRVAVAFGVYPSSSSRIGYIKGDAADDDPSFLVTPTDHLTIDLDQVKRQRGYGLFLAEKAVEFLENPASRKSPRHGDEKKGTTTTRERIVVLGTGWGSTAFLKNVDTDLFDVTVVSPRNYFLFTPLLAGASVGSLEYRSITEPVREINPQVSFLEGTAVYIDPKERTVIVNPVECEGNHCAGIQDQEEIPYDRLVFAIGARTNTFGIPGVGEHCNFLRQVGDARKIRAAVVNCFERAGFPDLSDEERSRFLTFCVIGAGPSGIEFAAELRDFIEQDGPKYYPTLLKYVRIKVIEGTSTVLAPFHESLQREAIRKLNSQVEIKDPEVRKLLPPRFEMTELLLDAFVGEVTEDTVVLKDGRLIPYGLAVWAAGNAPLALTQDLIEELGDAQTEEQGVARGRLAVDRWLRTMGGEGKIFALGDAACIVEGQLPATGQVAAQQGEYLARLFNKRYDLHPTVEGDDDDGRATTRGSYGTSRGGARPPPLPPPTKIRNVTDISCSDRIAGLSTGTVECAKPFQYLDMGILAYSGRDTALAQIATVPGGEPIMATGFIGSELWKTIYLWKQVSWRNRIMVVADWMKRRVFGRDITHLD